MYRVIIKNIHPSELNKDDIELALADRGYTVRDLFNIQDRKTKESLSLF